MREPNGENAAVTSVPFATLGNENELSQRLAAIAGETGSYTSTFGSSFTRTSDLLTVNLGVGVP